MTIADEITRIKTNISNAYTSCKNKGATLPETKNSANLATTIDSISGGSSPTLVEKEITENGTYSASNDNADGYSSVTVNVAGGGSGDFIGIPREISSSGVYQIPSSSFTFSLPDNATNLGNYALNYAFYNSSGLTSVNLSNLTTVSGGSAMNSAFYNCTGLTSVDLSSLTTVSGNSAMNNAFYNCTGLTSVDLSSLTTVSGNSAMSNAFKSCTGLTSVDLSNLTTVSGNSAMNSAFNNCTGLTSANFSNLRQIGSDTTKNQDYGQLNGCFNYCNKMTELSFPSLEKIYCTGSGLVSYGTFSNNNKVEKMYFPKLNTITYSPAYTGTSTAYTGACNYVFANCSALTEIHFGAKNKEAIEATTGYPTLWGRGAGNATVYFDL